MKSFKLQRPQNLVVRCDRKFAAFSPMKNYGMFFHVSAAVACLIAQYGCTASVGGRDATIF